MNKAILWVVGAVVILGGAYLIFANQGGSGSAGTADITQTGTQAQGQTGSGTFADIAAMGGSVKCDITSSEANAQMSGTVYVSGGKMRGDFAAQTSAGSIQVHMVSDGQFVYNWNSMTSGGFKIAVAKAKTSGSAGSSQNVYNQNVNYTCTPWTADASQFQLPAGVTFSEVGGGASGGAGASVGGNCAMCDQAPDAAAKAQCRAALGCK